MTHVDDGKDLSGGLFGSAARLFAILLGMWAVLLVAFSSAEERRSSTPLIVRVEGDWSASSADVQRVLDSAGAQLMIHFHDRRLKPIVVSRGGDVPITFDAKGRNGEYRVRLSTGGAYWAQYTYQFAHELCHILANYDHHHSGRNQWFEEALCETSSLYVLSRMRQAWEVEPPYPNWKDWGVHFDEYLNAILANRARRLPPDQNMTQWVNVHLPELAKESNLTEKSKLVAAYLLPIFQDEPDGWEALNWLNLGEKDDEVEFSEYLRGWRARVPERHKAFVDKIQTLFGYTPK